MHSLTIVSKETTGTRWHLRTKCISKFHQNPDFYETLFLLTIRIKWFYFRWVIAINIVFWLATHWIQCKWLRSFRQEYTPYVNMYMQLKCVNSFLRQKYKTLCACVLVCKYFMLCCAMFVSWFRVLNAVVTIRGPVTMLS